MANPESQANPIFVYEIPGAGTFRSDHLPDLDDARYLKTEQLKALAGKHQKDQSVINHLQVEGVDKKDLDEFLQIGGELQGDNSNEDVVPALMESYFAAKKDTGKLRILAELAKIRAKQTGEVNQALLETTEEYKKKL